METYQVRQELPVDPDLLGPLDLDLGEFKASEYFQVCLVFFPMCFNFEANKELFQLEVPYSPHIYY